MPRKRKKTRPSLPRAPLPPKTGGPHKDKRRPARVNERVDIGRKEPRES